MKAPILTGTRSVHEVLSTIGSAQLVAGGGWLAVFLVMASGLGLTAYNIVSGMKEGATLEDLARRIDELAEQHDESLSRGVIAKPADMALAFEKIADMQDLPAAKMPFTDIRRPWLMLVEWLDARFQAASTGQAAIQGIAETLREGFDTRMAVLGAEQRELLTRKSGELVAHCNESFLTLQAQLAAIREEGIETFLSVDDLRKLTQELKQESATEHAILFDAVMQLQDLLKGHFQQSAAPAWQPTPPSRSLHSLPGRLGDRFTGRDLAVLTDLHFAKPALPGSLPLVLYGPMGVGKTTLAAELLYQLHDAGVIDHAILLPAGDPVAVPKLTENLALVLGLVPTSQGPVQPQHARQALAAWFSAPENAGRVVLFFDNADTPESRDAVRKEVAAFPMLRVLATSRRSDWQRATLHEVKEWTLPQALDFLGKRLPEASQQDHQLLCKELGRLPLALELCAAVMIRLRLDASGLLDRWRTKLKDEKVADRDGDPTVAALLAISLESLEERPRLLFFILAQYAPQALPEKLVEPIRTGDLRENLAMLAEASLLEWSGCEIALHPFIRQATLQGMTKEAAEEFWLIALVYLATFLPDADWSERWGEWAQLHPHIAALWHRMPAAVPPRDSPWGRVLAEVLSAAGFQFKIAGAYSEVEPLIREALRLAEATFDKDHPTVAAYLGNLGVFLSASKRLAEAEPLLREALRIDQAAFGNHDPAVARDLNNLALLLKDTNRLAEAEPLMREALRIDQMIPGRDALAFATHHDNLGILLQATNRFGEAEFHMREALRIGRAALGGRHHKIATHLNNLALLLQLTNRYTEAERLMREALHIDQTAFGKNHPGVARDLSNLMCLLYVTGQFTEAESMGRKLLWLFSEFKRRTAQTAPPFQRESKNYIGVLRALGVPEAEVPERLRIATEEEPPDCGDA